MRHSLSVLCLSSLATLSYTPVGALAAEIDARPPDRLTLSANGSQLKDVGVDEDGAGGSLNYLHYVTPNFLFGAGGEHQTIAESKWSFGSLRASYGRGEPAKRFNIFGEIHYGEGDESGRDFDYQVGVLGISQAITNRFSVQLESRQIDIDTSHGNLPKLSLTYLWSKQLVTSVSYADTVGGNLGTDLTSTRLDYYGQHFNFLLGGAIGTADPSVVNLLPGFRLPPQDLTQGFAGVGKAFSWGEILLLGDYLEVANSEKVTLTLNFTAYLGARGPNH
jgi:hypothetical protein